jgi:hypothetical protein
MLWRLISGAVSRLMFPAGILLMATQVSLAQPFEAAGISFAGAGRSSVTWADYDNDHDLDVLVSGLGSGDVPVTMLYRNDAGSFNDQGMPFMPVEESSAAWGDYDRDGDLDLLLCGNSAGGDVTLLYRNDGAVFTEMDPDLPAIQNGDARWVDIDHDADLDIFLTGNWLAQLYINDGGVFTSAGLNLGYYSSSSADFGDFDNDGDLDLLINGDSGAGAVSRIFRNDDGTFTDIQAGFTGLMAGTAEWVDYDNDGDLDASISGFNDALEAQFCLYKNERILFFQVFTGIEGFATGDADWGDYDSDGDADLLLSGKATGCGAVASGIYRNEGNDNFFKLSDEITPATRCALGWADFENDGDLDFMIAGLNLNDYPFTKLYLNTAGDNQFVYNDPPAPPDSFTSEIVENSVILGWSGAADDQTAEGGLQYNIMVGSSSGACDVVTPMALYPDGFKLVSGNGNAGQTPNLKLEQLPPGTYYWSIQSIDQAFEGSVFSTENSFTITATGIEEGTFEKDYLVWPNPATGFINIESKSKATISEVSLLDLSGRTIRKEKPGSSSARIDISALNHGIYILTIQVSEKISNTIFIKH